ncbi:MAG TPA: glutamine-hydrolyzing carbamoyl-phosphate synthase small subunit [Sphaerochaetaceae bacterium]|jgi:carbamoyl-phosphate synthase small subunit|nr:glutamine-hydrolyzing carbamoyl-phosphate synthase small subunit [Sphaerochaetaceae bacterium]
MYDTELILSDGTRFPGCGFGQSAPEPNDLLALDYDEAPIGELVFNTGMGVYHEIITDPSYAGQAIVMTSPHIGNYGCSTEWNEMLDSKPPCKSLIVRDIYAGPVADSRRPLDTQCREWNLAGLSHVDTRALTLHIRTNGNQYGVLVKRTDDLDEFLARIITWMEGCPPMVNRDFVTSSSLAQSHIFHPNNEVKARYALWDFGTKKSIIQQLVQHDIEVTVFPCTVPLKDIFVEGHHFDALFLSNGPGDPVTLSSHVDQLKLCIGIIPILGICLGHQLAALALGAQTEKMLFGHHGSNHPVRDLDSGRVYVTAQNHGYCVSKSTLPATTTLWLINDNDGSVEGLFDQVHRVMTVQFHPEASPGPWEGRALFRRFTSWVARSGPAQKTTQEVPYAR